MQKNSLLIFIGVLLLFVNPDPAFSQTGDEWINLNQQYYKIPISREGAYQLDYNTLINAELPLATIDARTFRIYHRGNEIAIRVTGQNDGRLDQGDVIQFLAKGNDGVSDTPLFPNPQDQPHTYYNIYSDTTAYFLTWRLDGVIGKRMSEQNIINNISNLPEESSYRRNIRDLLVNSASGGQSYSPANQVFKSAFDLGEGWTGSPFTVATNFSVNNIINQSRSDENPNFEIMIQGRNARDHQAEVLVGATSGSLRSLGSINFSGYGFNTFASVLEWTDINVNGSMVVRIIPQGTAPDRMSVSYISLDYSKTFNMENDAGKRVRLKSNPSNRSFVRFTNTNSSAQLYRINDFNEPVLLRTNRVGSEINTVIENTNNGANLYLQNQNFIIPPIFKVNFRNYGSVNPDYVIISHTDLMQPSGDYDNPVKSYGTYRKSATGGAYDTLIADVQNLYDQFNYGETSPMAIYRFTRFLNQNKKTRFIFLIGKGLNWFHNYYRQTSQNSNQFREFVPTAGFPGSDNLYSFNLGADNEAAISFGRLNAHNPTDVANYLDKIIEMEANPIDNLRRKNFLHLSGGLSAFEVNQFKNNINDFTAYAESPFIGGRGINISKETTQVVELINVSDEVNEGLALITFFGHSSTGATDIDIGFISNDIFGYENKGKYPFFLINGCNAGSFYQQSKNEVTFGEDWVNAKDKGALGVFAHSALGFTNELKRYSDIFYAKAFGDSSLIDEPIGTIHLEVTKAYLAIFGNSPAEVYVAQAQQVNLMGDPAYRLFPADQPDLAVENEDLTVVSLDGEPINALTEEFGINIIVKNLGITFSDSFGIVLNRVLPNNEVIEQPIQYFPAVFYEDTLQLRVFNESIESFGNNRFEIVIDPENEVMELNETNNTASIEFFLALGTTDNLYPYDFSITNQQNLNLTAQSINLLSEARDFLFELDTSRGFNSPYLRQNTINARVLANWNVNLLNIENQTYYWRTKFANPVGDELDQWTTYSFTYQSATQQGWMQNRTDQFKLNSIEGLTIEEGPWAFEENTVELEVTTPANSSNQRLSIIINGTEFSTFGFFTDSCKINTLNLVAFDRSSGAPYRILSGTDFDVLDPLSCGRSPQVINQIRNNQLSQPATFFKNYYDQLPNGDFVLLTSYDSVAWNVLLANNRLELLDLGASASIIDNLQNGEPYILLGRKGLGAGNGTEIIANTSLPEPTSEQTIALDALVEARYESGTIFTQQVGPVKQWFNLEVDYGDVEASDDIQIDVFGVDTLGNQVLLYSDAVLPLDLSSTSSELYPFLRLRAILSDPGNLTSPKILAWKVNFIEEPDGILVPAEAENATVNRIAEGEIVNLDFKFTNVTPNSFSDSIVYQTQVFNKNTRTFYRSYDTIPPLAAFAEGDIQSTFDTRDKTGLNNVSVLVNFQKRFSEEKFTNNIINYPDFADVKQDSLPPFIDVTFDGMSILDGDIISPTPAIRMTLKDENVVLPKQDTTGIVIELERLCENCESRRIAFSDPRVEWTPATVEQSFSVQYQPEGLEDGMYQLRVQATDESDNAAGAEPYKIRFEVINASTITNFYPYPNPFSTQTRFVFTLTGSEIPNEIKIQILTVTGRVVREILQDEIGPINIGNNITSYAWDGRDEFGDKLANGVYLYRVLVRINGAFMEQRATSGDKAFKKGYGKLYILR